jgi:hypothetical protein
MNSYRVDRQKWQVLSIFEQMGNIYAEVGRTFAAKRRNDSEAALAAAVRSFDLFDATCESLAEHRSPKLTEVLRAREEFAKAFTTGEDLNLEKYFSEFAVVARMRQFV